jgi:hypothetical protein
MSRILTGTIVLPPTTPSTTASVVCIEIRDTSVIDAPSALLATTIMRDIPLHPGGSIPFTIDAPDDAAGTSSSFRVHISFDGSASLRPGDLLTTVVVPVQGESHQVPVTLIR